MENQQPKIQTQHAAESKEKKTPQQQQPKAVPEKRPDTSLFCQSNPSLSYACQDLNRALFCDIYGFAHRRFVGERSPPSSG